MTSELIHVFGRIGLLSFGGPAAQIALMHQELVEKRSWLSEEQFLRALSFCMLLPGPEAMQLATYAGWKKGGILGGLIGGGLFVLPGAVIIAVLALLYGAYGDLTLAAAIFLGIKAAVVVIVIAALMKVAKRALKSPLHLTVAVGAFLALFVFDIPFPIVILVAALIGAASAAEPGEATVAPTTHLRKTALTLIIGVLVWFAPLVVVIASQDPFLKDIGFFFSTLAVVTFGGAYAVLAYMTQEVVFSYGWLSTAQMMDALGLAETTPGPLILVTQFVGMIAGMAQGGIGLALVAGALTLWVTFVPCFVWIFAGAPLIDWLEGKPRLQGALATITAAVVGVIVSLSLWFAAYVFFGHVHTIELGPIRTISPDIQTLNPIALILAGIAAILLLWRHWPLPLVLLISATLSPLIDVMVT